MNIVPLTNSKRVLWKYFYHDKISFSLVSERLRYCNFEGITLQVVSIQKILVFDAEIGRLCVFKDGDLSQKLESDLYKVRLYLTSFVFIDILADNYDIYSIAYDRTYRIQYTTYCRMADRLRSHFVFNLNNCSV